VIGLHPTYYTKMIRGGGEIVSPSAGHGASTVRPLAPPDTSTS
jgi:hypothetical protein